MKISARVIGIRKIEADRQVVSGVKRNDCRPKHSGPYTFRRLGGGHGDYMMPAKLLVHVKDSHGDEHELDVAVQFRQRFGPHLSDKRNKAIINTLPSSLELEVENGDMQVSDASIEDWYLLAKSKM